MGLIVNLIKDFLKWLKPNHDRQSQGVLGLIIVFVGLFFVVALFGMASIRLILIALNRFYLLESYGDMIWLFYGVILGISFAFFGQGIPSYGKEIVDSDSLYKSFKHHFKYFVFFITAVVWWCGLILFILVLLPPL